MYYGQMAYGVATALGRDMTEESEGNLSVGAGSVEVEQTE